MPPSWPFESPLECVPQCELHPAIDRQGLGKVPKRAHLVDSGICRQGVEANIVENVVDFPPELQLLALRDLKNLMEAHVCTEVSRSTKGVAVADFSRKILPVRCDRGGWILEDIRTPIDDGRSGFG